jgi:hypothetical protein
MNIISWLGIVSAVITILAFLFAVWVWMRANTRVRELEGIIQSAYDITGTIEWNMHMVGAEDLATRFRNAENSLGLVSALHITTGKYAKTARSFGETEIGAMLERGVIWNHASITELERSARVQEIWLFTPDLQPDLSEAATGRIVARNLKAHKRYVYFCPNDIHDFDAEKKRLLANIGALRSPEVSRVTVVPISANVRQSIFQRGNTIVFFFEDPEWGACIAFEEIVFTKISARGFFWQEHTESVAAEIRTILKQELHNWREGRSS